MAAVHAADTRPEMLVRRLVHRMGYRYRLHVAGLAGKPDLVFPGRRKALFVHGCFWHFHEGCPGFRRPKSRLGFWLPKLEGNRERDQRTVEELTVAGWDVLVVWECEMADLETLAGKIRAFLEVAGVEGR